MNIDALSPLLGGLSPSVFMKRHWQKKPLLIRQAVAASRPLIDRATLFELAGREGVESRLIERRGEGKAATVDAVAGGWRLRHGPFTRRQLPPLTRPDWTLLVQGVDLYHDAAHALLAQFRFAPDARLDDLMVSYASDGGGVGPHVDSYDVFLLQLQGRRRWRIGRVAEPALQAGLPLKILANFVAEEEWLLAPGDMLYLPPKWGHEGVAEGECITASIGFRAASRHDLGTQVLQRVLDAAEDDAAAIDESASPPGRTRDPYRDLYRDPAQPATAEPARIPAALSAFAADAVARLLADPQALQRALGEWLSEPKPQVWYDEPARLNRSAGLRLDRRTRMLYDERHIFVNGESFVASGRDATLLREVADRRRLAAADVARLSAAAWELMQGWADDGWLIADSSVD